jgi:hypothetical protein
MKTQAAEFSFPVLGFTPDGEIWGFDDLDALTSCGPRTLKEDMQAGMELIDAKGRRWIVRSVTRIGRAGPLIPWLVSAVLTARPQSRIEHELEEQPPVSLDEVKARACASLEAFPTDYGAEDASDPELRKLTAKVRSARSVARIHDLLGLDSFMAC